MNPAVATVISACVGGLVVLIGAVINAAIGRGGRRADIADKITESSDRIMTRMDREIAKVEAKCDKCETRLAATQRSLEDMEVEFRRTKSALRALIRVLDENDPAQIQLAVDAARELT